MHNVKLVARLSCKANAESSIIPYSESLVIDTKHVDIVREAMM